MTLQRIKNHLVGLGPENKLTQIALRLHGRRCGMRVSFNDPERIWISQGNRKLALSRRDATFVPIMMQCMNLFFDSIQFSFADGFDILDFSRPAFQIYRRNGVGFFFPGIPEEDPLDQYTYRYTPQPGDIVWDAGAYCGATSCLFASMVGPTGKVYAFEPDELNFAYLQKNIAHHGFTNIVPIPKALSGSSGTATFFMGGTMASGISDFVVYSDRAHMKQIPMLSMEDACGELGSVPTFVKMDIEGAELSFIRGAQEFLKQHPVHFAIESDHRVEGELTHVGLDSLFTSMGYESLSDDHFQQMFTWAKPSRIANPEPLSTFQ